MDSALTLPAPANLRTVKRGAQVTSDVYHIAERVREIDPNLRIYPYESPVHVGDKVYNFVITELCADGVERMVYRVEALDARVIERLQYMLKIPFAKRLEAAEKLEAKAEAQRKEDELDELYERMGRPMWSQLEHDGFTQRSRSYPKRGIKPR